MSFCVSARLIANSSEQLRSTAQKRKIEQISTLAKLGHGKSQFQLATYYENKSTAIDYQHAYSWYLMAKDNHFKGAAAAFKEIRSKVKNKRLAKDKYLSLREKYGLQSLTAHLYPRLVRGEDDIRWPTNQSLTARLNPLINIPKNMRRKHTQAWSLWLYNLDWTGNITNLRLIANTPELSLKSLHQPLIKQQKFEPVRNDGGEPDYVTGISQLIAYGFTNDGFPTLPEVQSANDTLARALLEQYNRGAAANESKTTVLEAAIAGQKDAQYQIALCLIKGKFCQKDLTKAKRWLQIAAKAGHVYASFHLAKLTNNDKSLSLLAQNNYQPAMLYYPKLLNLNNKSLLAYKLAYQNSLLMPGSPLMLYSASQLARTLGFTSQSQNLMRKAQQLVNKHALPKDYLEEIK